MIWLFIGLALLLLALFGTPLFVIISAIALAAFHFEGTDPSAVIISLNRLTSQSILLAIPLFTFAGYLLAESNTPKRLINLFRALFSWMPGGLAIVTLVSCAVFTAFTGASGVTIIALGGLLYPILLKEKYPEKFTLGMLTVSGNLGLLFPPSLPIILYGLVSGVNIDKLFLAGILPGLLMILALSVYSVFFYKKQRLAAVREKTDGKKILKAIREAAWEIPLPVIILGGIYGGFFTPIEAAAVTAFYVLVVEVFIYKDISLKKDLVHVIRESMILVGGILVILGAALGLANYMITESIPDRIFDFMSVYISSKIGFLLVLNIFLLIVGAMMDIFSAIMVVVPIIIPLAGNFGVDPVHLGVIFLANLGIGYSTPPVGMNLFIETNERGEYVFAKIETKGQSTIKILPAILQEIISSLTFPKTMRWDDSGVTFARPVRWILALLDDKVVEFDWGHLQSSNITFGHRFMAPGAKTIPNPDAYFSTLKDSYVILDSMERKFQIAGLLDEEAKKIGGKVLKDDELLETVAFLVEYPKVVCGKFSEEFLKLPDQVLIRAMAEHQKYFSVVDREGKLLPYFLNVIGNAPKDVGKILISNERVLLAK